MTAKTADMLVLESAEVIALPERGLAAGRAVPARGERPARPRPDDAPARALRDTWRAIWTSRLLVWAAGLGTVLAVGPGPTRHALNPRGLTTGLGWLGDRVVAPAARWDAGWYLAIARHGYVPQPGLAASARAAFFPLYPLLVGVVSAGGIPLVAAGIIVSIAAMAAAMYGLHRLTAVEIPGRRGAEAARLAVAVTAFFPAALFLSAVYSESLFLALSVGVFWFARQGRWAWACLLGGLAAATRSTGIALLIPIALIYLYGPRQDRWADLSPALGSRLRPRYRVRSDAAWLVLVPLGLAAYAGYLALSGGDPLLPFRAQGVWHREFAGPFMAVEQGTVAAWDAIRQLALGAGHPAYSPPGEGDPAIAAQHNLLLFGFLVAIVPALVGVLRRLPVAYGAYVVAALALPLSYPDPAQPLMSLPRFEIVLFPLAISAGAWLAEHPRARVPLLTALALGLAVFAAQFSTWHWVA